MHVCGESSVVVHDEPLVPGEREDGFGIKHLFFQQTRLHSVDETEVCPQTKKRNVKPLHVLFGRDDQQVIEEVQVDADERRS